MLDVHDRSRSGRATPRRSVPAFMRVLVGAVLLSLLAVACGDGSDDPQSTPTGSPAGQPSPTATTTDAAAALTEVRVAFVPATTGLLLHVAQEQGFFEDNGLDAELTEAANISEIPPALGRQFEITLGTATDLIRAADAGLDVVQIVGNTNSTEDNPFVRLIVHSESGIADITGLEGRRVGTPTLSGVIHVATLFWAQQEGVDPATISGVQVPPPNLPDQLNARQVDAVEALEPFATQLVANDHISLGDPFAAIGLPLATNFWMANGQWADDNPDAVAGFRTALEQALDYVASNEEEARAVLQGYTGMPAPVAGSVPLPTFNLDVRVDDLATWIQVLRDLGEFDGDVTPEELVLSDT